MKKLFCILVCIFLLACTPQASQQATFYVFGTSLKIILPDANKKEAEKLFAEIQNKLLHMHRRWHAWQQSELSEINNACHSSLPVKITPETKELILLSQRYEQQSLGYFNPAIGGLIDKWGYLADDYTRTRPAPDEKDLDALLQAKPSMQDIEINDNVLYCNNPNLRLDFGGIAKGYASMEVMEYLQTQNINNALIDAGGDVQTLGNNQGKPWHVAIYSPNDKHSAGILQLTNNESVFTSGSYERAIADDHHHIINPKTGYPANEFVSATVITFDPVLADAAATALLLANQDDWQQLIQNLGVEAALLIDAQGNTLMTSSMLSYLKR